MGVVKKLGVLEHILGDFVVKEGKINQKNINQRRHPLGVVLLYCHATWGIHDPCSVQFLAVVALDPGVGLANGTSKRVIRGHVLSSTTAKATSSARVIGGAG